MVEINLRNLRMLLMLLSNREAKLKTIIIFEVFSFVLISLSDCYFIAIITTKGTMQLNGHSNMLKTFYDLHEVNNSSILQLRHISHTLNKKVNEGSV